jgi:hypothetical protein
MSAPGSAQAANLSDAELAIWDADFVNEECVETIYTTKSKSKADERQSHTDTSKLSRSLWRSRSKLAISHLPPYRVR